MNSTSNSPQTAISVISTPKLKVTQKNKNNRCKKYFKEYCENAGIHGFRYLAEDRSLCERFLWGILILTSIATCCYLISRIYKKYDQSPVIVSFATKESAIFTIPFPAVTICPTSKSNRMKFNYTKTIHKIKKNQTVTPEEKRSAQYLASICEEGREYFPKNKTFTEEFFDILDKLQVSMTSFFPCKFMGREYDCEEVLKHILLDEGVCRTFNMLDREEIFNDNVVHYSKYHKNDNRSTWNINEGYSGDSKVDAVPRRALLSGYDNAFEIILLQFARDIDYLCVEDVQGYSVVLHTPHSIPSPYKQYFQVPFDSSVIVAIQPKMMTTSKEVKKYDPIDRECYFTNERPLKYFKIYTPENCRLECLTNYTLEQCGCVDFFMPREKATSICGNGNIDCMTNAEKDLKEIELKNLIDLKEDEEAEVYCDCMPLCTQLSYDMEQSQSEWEWDKQLEALEVPGHKTMKTQMKLAKLSVFFKQEQFLTSQRNELYGPIDFLANFGGLLGLFIGFSFLSLMEIIYFFTIRIFCNIRQHKVWSGTTE